ncbi:putative dolichyl-diphosphooligosaccharide--protein glycotransferase [Dioscorea sansibarensis]
MEGIPPWRAFILVLVVSSLFSVLGSSSSSSPPSQDVRILSAERRIDLTSFIVRAFLALKVENTGASDVSEILIALSPNEAQHLAIVKASATAGKRKKKAYLPLDVNPIESPKGPNGVQLFSIVLPAPLKSGDTAALEVLYVLTHSQEPFPAEISQSESQYVYYRDSALLLSPYHITEQRTFIKTTNSKVESYTNVSPSNRVGTELRYGPYHDRSPYSHSPILVHFENNNPFAVVEELTREVEISHWGNVQITEHYKLSHAGARHKGVFSRVEYQARPSISGVSSFKYLLARLPPRVHSVYYRDEIGNISSSHLRSDSLKSELEIEPRYPLFGGWKATFVIGYGLPLQDFLFESSDGQHYLNFTFGCPLLETVVDRLTIKVVLPEGSKDPSAVVPFPVKQHYETSYSYLDVVGRKTLVLVKENVVPEHNVPFEIYYKFNPFFMLAEPLMLISAFFLFFIACIAYLHMDLSISK